MLNLKTKVLSKFLLTLFIYRIKIGATALLIKFADFLPGKEREREKKFEPNLLFTFFSSLSLSHFPHSRWFLSLSLFIYLSFSLSFLLSLSPFLSSSISVFVHLPIYLSLSLFIYLSFSLFPSFFFFSLSFLLSLFLSSLPLSLYVFAYLFICLCLSFSISYSHGIRKSFPLRLSLFYFASQLVVPMDGIQCHFDLTCNGPLNPTLSLQSLGIKPDKGIRRLSQVDLSAIKPSYLRLCPPYGHWQMIWQNFKSLWALFRINLTNFCTYFGIFMLLGKMSVL